MSQNSTKPDKPGQVADAITGNWVDNFAPIKLRPYLRLSRADRPIGTWLLLIPCWWGLLIGILEDENVLASDFWLLFSCSIGAFLMRGAGCTWNDILDRKIDGAVERTRSRPIPSGQVNLTQAIVWMIVQIGLAGIILLSYNLTSIILGLSSLFLVAIYPFAKRFTWWPQVFLGLAFNWGILLLFVAHTGSLSWPIIALYFSGIFWTLGYDTIYALQDKKDDLIAGVKSSALKLNKNTKFWLFIFYFLATISLLLMGGLLQLNSIYFVLVFLSSFQLFWQVLFLKVDNPKSCLGMFQANKLFGWLILCAVFFGKFT